jgi:hypothetical protein
MEVEMADKKNADNKAADTPAPPISEEQFWDNYSRDSITNSITKIEESGAKIQTAVSWFWTIYTASAVVGTSIFKPSFPWYINLLIALPILFMMIAYYFAVRVQVPVVVFYDDNILQSVKLSHLKTMIAKKQEKNRALISLLITSLSIFFAIVLSFSYQPGKTIGIQTSQIVSNNSTIVALTGHFLPSKQIFIKIESLKDPNNPVVKKFVTDSSSSAGDLIISIPVDEVLTTYNVITEWQGDDGLTHSLKKIIKP